MQQYKPGPEGEWVTGPRNPPGASVFQPEDYRSVTHARSRLSWSPESLRQSWSDRANSPSLRTALCPPKCCLTVKPCPACESASDLHVKRDFHLAQYVASQTSTPNLQKPLLPAQVTQDLFCDNINFYLCTYNIPKQRHGRKITTRITSGRGRRSSKGDSSSSQEKGQQ